MTRKPRQIIAMGGGTFASQPDNPALDAYALAQSRAANPAVCFLPTATGDASSYIYRYYHAFSNLNCRPTHASLFTRTPDLRALLLRQDVIYVGGGNTKSMLAVWREWNLPAILREAWRDGIVLAGVSAGAICWFDMGVTDSWDGDLAPLYCLGMLAGTCCPHYDGEADRRPALHRLLTERRVPSALALDDGVAAHFVGDRLYRVVSTRAEAKGYSVRISGDEVVETPLRVKQLEPSRTSRV